MFVGYVHIFFGEMSVYILNQLLVWTYYYLGCLFFWYCASWVVCVFRRLIPYQLLCCKYFLPFFCCYCSVTSYSLWSHELQHARLPSSSPSPRACSNSCPSSRWCHPTISSSVVPFSSCLQSFSASESFLMSWLFASGSQGLELHLRHQSFQRIFRIDFL